MPARVPWLIPLLAVAAVVIHLLPPAVAAALEFDRTAVAAGELWRLATAHLTHFDADHLVWDVAVLVALGWSCERRSRGVTALTLLAAAGAISVAVWAWQPQFARYRGLSGLDCTLFALHAGALLGRPETAARVSGGLALLALGGKCLVELATGTTVFAEGAGYAPVPLAHLLGGAIGGLGAVWAARRERESARPRRARIVAKRGRLPTLPESCRNCDPSSMNSPAARTIISPACATARRPGRASRKPSRSTIPGSIRSTGARS